MLVPCFNHGLPVLLEHGFMLAYVSSLPLTINMKLRQRSGMSSFDFTFISVKAILSYADNRHDPLGRFFPIFYSRFR